ncbi:hypothetical protein Ddye_029298 [Dipteronia dyeriana]|uniref:Uncharacterized protein n=1 Tax=Dipteronia dyeriana TaxID=168575 RepID=A0AAD9TEY3_9ROSI|nr:hypothetical protein Ddye_029298 [Dipteronia dyeriana]
MVLVKFRVAWWFKNLGKGFNESFSLLVIDIAERCLDLGKIKDAIIAERLAIAKACELCVLRIEMRGKMVVINSDSKNTVSWINIPGLENINFMHLIYDILNSLFKFNQLWVEFNPRDSKLMEDYLAKREADGDGGVINWLL